MGNDHQGLLFEIAATEVVVPARRNNPNGLRAARKLQRSGRAGTQEVRVLGALRVAGPMTQPEVTATTGIPINAATGRIKSLRDKGQVEIAGKRIGAGGGPVNLYRITAAGKARLR